MPFRPPSAKAVTPGGKGRFPGFDVLDEVDHWDDVTAGVVLARLDPQPEVSFFTVAEQATAAPLFDQLLGQDREPKVPVLLLVDRRLALGQTDGWHYEDMPEDGDAWRRTLGALDDEAQHLPWRPIPPADLGTARGTGPSSRTTPKPGTACRGRMCGACGPVTRARRSTPTPGRGTRSVSAALPTLAGTKRSASESGRGGRWLISTALIR